MRKKTEKFRGLILGSVFIVLALIVVAIPLERRLRLKEPDTFSELDDLPSIFPDYVETTLPVNLAPINFRIEDEADDYATKVSSADGASFVVRGRDAIFPEKKWRRTTNASQGGRITFDVFVKREGRWNKFKSFGVVISPDKIDPWIAYRLIEPGYEFGHRIFLAQRSLESFQEKIFADNRSASTSPCLNCHSFQDRKTDRFLFHFRQNGIDSTSGGTILVEGKNACKITAKFEALGASCTYPSWRPTGDIVVFSANQTRQYFHSLSTQKVEVYDVASDLVLFDAAKNEITPILCTPDDFETFPYWSPDGKTLYYCSARVELDNPLSDPTKRAEEVARRVDEFHYNIYKMDFDETTRSFGEPEIAVDAASRGETALFPRVSPDGKYLVYSLAHSGTFPIWRPETDLWIKDLTSGDERAWTEVNSDESDSYHSWSSSGRWLIFSSRREDGQYTRLFFARVDENGRATKPFVLPQKNPECDREFFKSYNVPEFIVEPIKISQRAIVDAFNSEAIITTNR